ncbi:hypothetical protein GH733_002186 [Mirounga leonina]|nr:hypothetical protein GH733_002186 [Mirounga leonina]
MLLGLEKVPQREDLCVHWLPTTQSFVPAGHQDPNHAHLVCEDVKMLMAAVLRITFRSLSFALADAPILTDSGNAMSSTAALGPSISSVQNTLDHIYKNPTKVHTQLYTLQTKANKPKEAEEVEEEEEEEKMKHMTPELQAGTKQSPTARTERKYELGQPPPTLRLTLACTELFVKMGKKKKSAIF